MQKVFLGAVEREGVRQGVGECAEKRQVRDVERGAGFQPAGWEKRSLESASPMRSMGDEKMVGRLEEKESAEEEVKAKVRATDAAPTQKEVEEHSAEQATFRSWHPPWAKVRAKARGRAKYKANVEETPAVSLGFICTHGEEDNGG